MEKLIDDSIKYFTAMRKTYMADTKMVSIAIDTMRKYQKIAEIYQWAKDRSYLVEADDIMDKLKEVVEDGQNTIKD